MAKRKKEAESKLNTTCSQLIELCLSKGPFKSTSLAKWHILTPHPLLPFISHFAIFFFSPSAPLFYLLYLTNYGVKQKTFCVGGCLNLLPFIKKCRNGLGLQF